MRFVVGIAVLAFVCVASAQEEVTMRYVNGAPVKGSLVSAKPDGLLVSVEGANKLLPWSALSAGTRFRYDAAFRDNLATAQRGMPPADWTNSLEGAGTDLLMSFRAFPSTAERQRGRLPGFRVSDGANAVSWGFRYGPKDSDVAFAVLEAAGSEELPSSLLLWANASVNPETLTGSRRASGSDATMNFQSQRFTSVREGVDVQSDLAFAVGSRDPGQLIAILDVELKKGGAASAFTLYGVPPGLLIGDGAIAPQDMLVTPSMKWTVSRGVLSGDVRMNRMQLLPRAGMSKTASVSISDEEGRVVAEEASAFREGRQDGAPALSLSLKALPSGQRYTLRARVDLGPFLGVLQHEETFVAP